MKLSFVYWCWNPNSPSHNHHCRSIVVAVALLQIKEEVIGNVVLR